MTRSADRLRRGLEEALAFVNGEATNVRTTEVEVTGVDVRAVREKLQLTQPSMAGLLGASTSGYRKWEQGVRRPGGAALTLLRIADNEPEAVLRAIQPASAPASKPRTQTVKRTRRTPRRSQTVKRASA